MRPFLYRKNVDGKFAIKYLLVTNEVVPEVEEVVTSLVNVVRVVAVVDPRVELLISVVSDVGFAVVSVVTVVVASLTVVDVKSVVVDVLCPLMRIT